MQTLSSTRTSLFRILGHPEFHYRIPSEPPMLLERYRAVVEVASIPPFTEPLIMVQTGGKQLSYRTAAAEGVGLSAPGLVSLLPAGVPVEFAVRGIGEAMLIYFDGPRHVPAWLKTRREREPMTFVDNVIVTLTQQIAGAAGEVHADDHYLAVLGNALLAQLQHVLCRPAAAHQALRGSRSSLLLAHLAVQYIQRHIDQPLRVAELAALVGVGVTHFSNTFKQVTGVSPHRYILRERIGRARELLRMTSLTVGEIATAVGFAGQSHFTRAFSREMGMTPSRYRNMGRG